MPTIPRPEYPRPQFVREDWLNLNGSWEFETDPGDTGLERGMGKRKLTDRITVPFCPESELSGVGLTDRVLAVWYRRTVAIPKGWSGKDVVLHFQAIDYDATVWVNGVQVARHRGGFTPFSCPLAGVAEAGTTATIVVRARDDWRPGQPRGKQTQAVNGHSCLYSRTTGIWQTVWLEAVNKVHLKRARITPDFSGGRFRVEQPLSANVPGYRVRATLSDAKGQVAMTVARADGDFAPMFDLEIPDARRRPWSPADPHLYDIELSLLDERGQVVDRVTSYAGLRSVTVEGRAIRINGERVFQRLVLDQGWYQDGLMTAPSEKALISDIELSLAAGFNGARLHQKVFEERFLYHADRMGYLCWGEFGDWGVYYPDWNQPDPTWSNEHHKFGCAFVAQWLDALERDYSHPSIVGWCPMNEQTMKLEDRIDAFDDLIRAMYLATKACDRSRPVLDISGWAHRVPESDVYDSHDYEQDPAKFKDTHAGVAQGKVFTNSRDGGKTTMCIPYRNQPYFVSEFGGAQWNPEAKKGEASWGYGNNPKTIEEFYQRFEGLCGVLLDNPEMFGYCYTQLTDVFQEQNGIYRMDRRKKFDLARIRAAQVRVAAYELVGKKSDDASPGTSGRPPVKVSGKPKLKKATSAS
ncbi:MAG: beta-galactosidase [Planctomycetes bacterium]|nr:beta-galactosidase [Planctomycetota bacterium]